MPIRRLLAAILALSLLIALASVALAHAELVSSDPASGSTLDEAPHEVVIVFDDELDPDGSELVVTDDAGREVGAGGVDLQVAERNTLRGEVSITADGGYEVTWTALAGDGHVASGSFTFTLGETTAASPDTAVARPATPLPTIGVGLALLALLLVARRLRRARVLVVAIPLVLAACVSDNRPDACDEAAVTLELQLTAESMSPSDPAVCRDQSVTLVIASQVDGIIHIHGYDQAVPATEVVAGEELRLAFTAERSGQFPIELHPAGDPQGVGVGVFTVHEP